MRVTVRSQPGQWASAEPLAPCVVPRLTGLSLSLSLSLFPSLCMRFEDVDLNAVLRFVGD